MAESRFRELQERFKYPSEYDRLLKDMSSSESMEGEGIIKSLREGNRPTTQHNLMSGASKPEVDVDYMNRVAFEEPKYYRALSEGIRDQKGFTAKHKTGDIIKELSSDMGIPAPDFRFKYEEGVGGFVKPGEHRIYLNPSLWHNAGREGLIAHELRHLKEGVDPEIFDPSPKNVLWGGSENDDLLTSLKRYHRREEEFKRLHGHTLSHYKGLDKNLHTIPTGDTLNTLDYIERGHFKKPFLKTNLERIAKGLPIIGLGATAIGALGYSDAAGAAVDAVIPGGVEELGVDEEQRELDRKFFQKMRGR